MVSPASSLSLPGSEAPTASTTLRPTAIIRDLELSRPIYRQLAAYGHMGREELGVRWEDTDRVDALRAAVAKA